MTPLAINYNKVCNCRKKELQKFSPIDFGEARLQGFADDISQTAQ